MSRKEWIGLMFLILQIAAIVVTLWLFGPAPRHRPITQADLDEFKKDVMVEVYLALELNDIREGRGSWPRKVKEKR